MADLSTNYLGLNLKSPLIAGSSGLTNSLDNLKQIEKNGAGAVVLKSIFEEEILLDIGSNIKNAMKDSLIYYNYSETMDYLDLHIEREKINNYLQLIREAKKEILIPVIASINCVTDFEWIDFTSKIQDAGADAIELNLFYNPTSFKKKDYEKISLSILEKIRKIIAIPIAVKISSYYTNLANSIKKISETGVNGIVLFNRFYSVDFDIDQLKAIPSKLYSYPSEYLKTLRWIALISGKINCSIAASGGVHSGEAAIKQILAGADAVQVVSALYENGIDYLSEMQKQLEQWMEKKGFYSIGQFKGKLNYENIKNPEIFERMQFMKYFSGIE